MKSVSELTDFYYNELYPDLEELDNERKEIASKVIRISVIIGILAAGICLWIIFSMGFNVFVFFIAIGAVALMGILYRYLTKDFTKRFKSKIIKRLIEAISPQMKYFQFLTVSQYHYKRSNLFKENIDRFSGNDLVKGDIDGTLIQFSDLHTEYKTKDSKGNETWHTVFKGLFITAEFNKHFNGKTTVLPDQAEKLFGSLIGGWLQSNNLSQRDLIKLDDPEFEKNFVVYGTDQIEARYLLTHTMMQRLLQLKKRSGKDIYVSFIGGQIYIAIAYNKDLFEPTVFSSLLEYKQVMEYITTLQTAIGIVEELKLNEKLWSKETRSSVDSVLHTHDALFPHQHL